MKRKNKNTFLEKIKLDFSKIILSSIVLNVLFLTFGIVIYINPYISMSTVGVIIGIYFILFGIFAIYEYFRRINSPIFTYKIFFGIFAVILGFFVMINPFDIVKILTFTLGVYLIGISVFKILEAFRFKKYGYDGWILVLVTSIILLIFGIFITINPMTALDIVQVTAIFIILSSILEIANLFMIYNKSKELIKLFKKAK